MLRRALPRGFMKVATTPDMNPLRIRNRYVPYAPNALLRAMLLSLTCALFGGCATSGQPGESLFAPTAISDLYSQATLQIKLAFTPGERKDQLTDPERECAGPTEFEQRVGRIGVTLAAAAYRTHPGLAERIPKFVFAISNKLEPGVASTAGGLIVVLQPVSEISLSDDALAFVMAREMGHVISRHHEQNTAASLAISVAATVLAPALNLARLLAFITSSSSTAAVGAQVTSSAASFAGSQAVIASYGDRQRRTADAVALRLMPLAGYNAQSVASGIVPVCSKAEPTKWLRQLHDSVADLAPARTVPKATNPAPDSAVATTAAPLTGTATPSAAPLN